MLPINPANLLIPQDANNQTANVVGLGDIVVPATPGLRKFNIQSYFPQEAEKTPYEYITFIENAWKTKKPLRFLATNIENADAYVLIQHFEYDTRAAEEEDKYFILDLIEYRPYGAQLINLTDEYIASPPTTPRMEENKPAIERTYIVKPDDNLISISKSLSGSDANWRELYEANKEIIGDNSDQLPSGITLRMPESWITS